MAQSSDSDRFGATYSLDGKNIPRYLYRYRSADTPYFEDELINLKNGKIYLSSSRDLNDPYDCNPVVEISSLAEFRNAVRDYGDGRYLAARRRSFDDRLLKIVRRRTKATKSFTKSLTRNVATMVRYDFAAATKLIQSNDFKTFYVASLSERELDPLMWAYYAANFSGICIKYSVSATVVDRDNPDIPIPVTYQVKRPTVTSFNVFRNSIMARMDDKLGSSELVDKLLFTKSECWRHEAEWRFAFPRSYGAGYRKFPSLKPAEIIAGPRMSKENRQKLEKHAPIPVINLKLSNDNYILRQEA